MLHPAIDATPWVLPGALTVVALSLVLSRHLARWLGSSAVFAFLLAGAFGSVVVVTVTPSADGGFWGRGRAASFEATLPTLGQLLTVNEISLNVALFLLPAIAAALVRRRTARRTVVALVWVLPLTVETVQYVLPVLGRSGFLLNDMVANMLGVAIGTAAGLLLRTILTRPSRQSRDPRPRLP